MLSCEIGTAKALEMRNAVRLITLCINGVSSNPVEGGIKMCQLKDLILTLFGLIFRHL